MNVFTLFTAHVRSPSKLSLPRGRFASAGPRASSGERPGSAHGDSHNAAMVLAKDAGLKHAFASGLQPSLASSRRSPRSGETGLLI